MEEKENADFLTKPIVSALIFSLCIFVTIILPFFIHII